jgi:hypothetical protein
MPSRGVKEAMNFPELSCRGAQRLGHPSAIFVDRQSAGLLRNDKQMFINEGACRAVAIQLECIVAARRRFSQ